MTEIKSYTLTDADHDLLGRVHMEAANLLSHLFPIAHDGAEAMGLKLEIKRVDDQRRPTEIELVIRVDLYYDDD